MKTTKDIVRRKIFESFSKNLELISQRFDVLFGIKTDNGFKNIPDKKYVCPLCCKIFFETALDQKTDNPLTIEDLPPKSTKKSILILTCKKCNNEAGYKLDYLIKQQLETEPFLKGEINSTITANLNLKNKKYIKGQFKILGDESLIFELPAKPTGYIEDSFKDFIQNWSKEEFTMKFNVPEKRKVDLAFLRIGYLIFFNYFGYLAILNENLKIIRDQLQQPNEIVLSNFGIVSNLEKKNVPEGVHIIKNPSDMRAYLVVIDISNESINKKVGIIIPGPRCATFFL